VLEHCVRIIVALSAFAIEQRLTTFVARFATKTGESTLACAARL
jgi:hypothetical protein